jgi:hypothetical protein
MDFLIKSKFNQSFFFWFFVMWNEMFKIVSSLSGSSGFTISRKIRDIAFLVFLWQRMDYRVACTFLAKCEICDSF